MPTKEEQGRAAWTALHLYCLDCPNLAYARTWINRFVDGLGCGPCRLDSKSYVQANPPDISSSEALFAYSVRWHNFVSAKPELNKPQWTVEQARTYWTIYKESHMPATPTVPTPRPTGPEQIAYTLNWVEEVGVQGPNVGKLVTPTPTLRTTRFIGDATLAEQIRGPIIYQLVSPAPTLAENALPAEKAKVAALAELHETIKAAVAKALPLIGE